MMDAESGEHDRVTTDEERVLRGGRREIRL